MWVSRGDGISVARYAEVLPLLRSVSSAFSPPFFEKERRKVTQGEYSKICSAAKSCNMTVSSFVRARCLGYKPKNKLSNEEIKLLGNLAKCRIDMVNFANALSGLTNEQKLSLFRNYRVMFDWYERVVPITNAVVDYLQSVQKVNDFPSSST